MSNILPFPNRWTAELPWTEPPEVTLVYCVSACHGGFFLHAVTPSMCRRSTTRWVPRPGGSSAADCPGGVGHDSRHAGQQLLL
jgi:hypothetical protein